MYEDAFDESEWSYACHFLPGGDADEDYARHLEKEADMAVRARLARETLAILIVQDRGVPAPNAVWRTRIASVTAAPEFRTIRCAIVTRNALIRGVVTALNWIRKREYQEAIFAELGMAVDWLEKTCERPLPALRDSAKEWNAAYGS